MSFIAERAKKGSLSPTFALAARARKLKEQGIKILDLAIGEPECGTPDNIKEAAYEAIGTDKTKYTAVNGIVELRNSIHKKYLNRIKADDFSPENVIVSSGAKYVLHSFFWSILNDGDEVLLPAPYWVSYDASIEMNGGVPVVIHCDEKNNFKVTVEQLEKSVTDKTKLLLINAPNNPTGMKYSKSELKEIAEFLKRHPKIYVLADDIYEDLYYDEERFSLIDAAPELWGRIIIVNGCSKSYSMTGWRIGYGIANREVIGAMEIMQSQSLSSPCSISQYAAVEAISGDQTSVKNYAEMLDKRRKIVYKFFNETENFSCVEPLGAFYVFPNCSKFINSTTPSGNIIKNDKDFCDYLLEEEQVLVVPGSAFNGENHFRLSYAVNDEILEKALVKIKQATSKLKLSVSQQA
jgi:aspartate aminotransferase